MLTVELNMYHGVALGSFLFWLGGMITDKVSLLNRYCIPAPLVGGLCFSILNCILYSVGIASISFDATLQTVFMIMFFTTVGFTVSIPTLLKGGKAVILCLFVSILMIPLQNFLDGGVMQVFGQDPLLGIGCGSIALIGGPGTAAAFWPDLEAAGAVGGSVVSIAAATFGLVAGSLIGGPTARRLIEKHDLRPAAAAVGGAPGAVLAADIASEDEDFLTSSPRFIKGFMLLLLAVGVGNQVSVWLKALTGLTFPAYIGAMLVAVAVRNVMDGMKVEYPAEEIDTMGNMFLSSLPGDSAVFPCQHIRVLCQHFRFQGVLNGGNGRLYLCLHVPQFPQFADLCIDLMDTHQYITPSYKNPSISSIVKPDPSMRSTASGV